MPSDSMKQISLEEEYKKNTGITPQDIAALRQWLKTQPHLPEEYITDLDLILAYHSCSCSTGLTKQVLDLNFTTRTLFGFLKDRKVDARVEELVTNLLLTPLSTPSREGYKMIFSHFINRDAKAFNFGEAVKVAFMILDIIQYEEGSWPGLMLVIDYEHFSLGHVAKIDLFNLQQFLYYVQDAVLVKLKGMHFLNAPSFIDKVLLMMKPFMKKELMEVLHIHSKGSQTLEKFIPIDALPKESGGKAKNYEAHRDEVLSKLRDYKVFFERDSQRKVTESLRPGKPKTISDIFGGVEGSFKKLDID